MRVDPEPRKRLRPSAGLHLLIKKVGHRFIIKFDHRPRARLHDEPHIFDEQQVILGGDPKPADLAVTRIAQE